MPGRRGRSGGKRNGAVGKAYPNRTDLNGGPQPVTAAPGQPYGARGAQEAAQSAVPMGTPEMPSPPPQFSGMPEGMARAGSLGDLFADSTAPDEHVMNGAARGPGLGPDAFGFGQQARRDQDMVKLRSALAAWEEIAARPNATNATKAFVRNIKAQLIGNG